MRLLGPVLAVLLVPAFGTGLARADARPLMTTQERSFELFGTSFCYAETESKKSCDVALPDQAMTVAPPSAPEPAPRVKIFGVVLCAHADPGGPRCDVVWSPPQPAQRWRDAPEVRVAEATPGK